MRSQSMLLRLVGCIYASGVAADEGSYWQGQGVSASLHRVLHCRDVVAVGCLWRRDLFLHHVVSPAM